MPSGLPTNVVTKLSKPIDLFTGDVLLDTNDLDLLCDNLTFANNPDDPKIIERRSLVSWLNSVGSTLGKDYISSVKRYYK